MGRNHSEIPFDAAVPQQPAHAMPPGMGMGGGGGHHGFGDSLGTEQAMINQVIEESLKS